ncbi:MAG: polysaccharide deacetylase family protein [Alphaproteobacteria bacterium]
MPVAHAADSAVVLVYQRFGEEARHPHESVTLEQFEAHLEQLKAGDFIVLPLGEVAARLAAHEALPERTVAITIDNAFRSAYREAWPRLKAAGLPFTLFVASDAVDAGDPAVMGWDELRELAAAGVAIESRGASNRLLWRLDQASQRADIERGRSRIEAELGRAPTLFAYPSGEHDEALRDMVKALGFSAAFGLRSGPAHSAEDRYDLPRFELSEPYADATRFAMVIDVLPLPIERLEPDEAILRTPRRAIAFTVADEAGPLDGLACYVSRQGRAAIEADAARRVRVTLAAPFESGHDNRVNCTLPAEAGRFRWLGLRYVLP